MSGEFDVLVCSTCTKTWIQGVDEWGDGGNWRGQNSVTCPHCESEHSPKKVKSLKEGLPTREAAGEWRARYLAKRAGEAKSYNEFTIERGQYAEQGQEVDAAIERAAPLSADKMDLKPISSDRYKELAENTFVVEDAKFSHWAEEYSGIGLDAFKDEVTLEDPDREICREYVDDALEGWADRPDADSHARGEVTVTDTPPVSAVAAVELRDTTITDLWADLFESDGLKEALATAIGERFGGMDTDECYDALRDAGVPFWLRTPIATAVRGQTRSIWQLVSELVPTLATNPLAAVEDLLTVASLFDALEESPTVAVAVREPFVDPKQVRRDQRVDVCDLLGILSASLDVQIAGSPNTLQRFADRHRSDLEGISEWCNQDRSNERIDETANAARRVLDPDGRKVAILRQLAAQPDEVLAREDIEDAHDVTTGRISQLLRNDEHSLTALGLVSVYGPDGSQMVALQAAGRVVLQEIDADVGRQGDLSEMEFFPEIPLTSAV